MRASHALTWIGCALTLLLLVSPRATNAKDACAKMVPELPVVPLSLARSCLGSFPFNAKEGKQTKKIILNSLNIYTYTVAGNFPPAGSNKRPFDIRREFDKTFAKQYGSEVSFQNALYRTARGMKDPHFVYNHGCFHTPFSVAHAFPVYSVMENGVQKVKVIPGAGFYIDAFWFPAVLKDHIIKTEKQLGIKVSDYASAEVIKINNQNPLKYLQNFAANETNFEDPNVAFNFVTAQLQYFGFQGSYGSGNSDGYFASRSATPFPPQTTVSIKLRRVNHTKVESLNVPLFAKYFGASFTDGPSFLAANCPAQPLTLNLASNRRGLSEVGSSFEAGLGVFSGSHEFLARHQQHPSEEELRAHVLRAEHGRNVLRERVLVDDTVVPATKLVDQVLTTYMTEGNKTGAIVIPNFTPAYGNETWVKNWIAQLNNSLALLKNSGAEYLIIDMTANSGGFVTFGMYLLNVLFPNFGPPFFNTEMRASPLAQKLAMRMVSPWNYDGWADSMGNNMYDPSQFFFPVVQRRYSRSNPFTLFKMFASDKFSKVFRNQFYNLQKPYYSDPVFPASNVMILTNGLCQSTCSLFAWSATKLGAKLVFVGGLDSVPQAPVSVGTAGDLVTLRASDQPSSAQLAVLMAKLSMDKDAFGFFPRHGQSLQLPYRQAMHWDKVNIPLEYIYHAADYKLSYTEKDAFDFTYLYPRAEALFD